ncbi:MAG TPA: hypothetical protein VLM89_05390 [Phycisphaerae bacterium]|nr:hypothetical protein [Phycisphaerae bacterium]
MLVVPGSAFAAVPVRLGVDDGGSYHHFIAKREPWEFPAYFKALEDLGARFLSVHFWPVTDAGENNSAMTRRRLEAMDRVMRDRGVEYTLNVELSNFVPRIEITPGVNEFEHEGGLHRWDLRMEWLTAVLPPTRPAPPSLVAVTYDECEHMILSNNKFSNHPKATYDTPFLVNTHGMSLTTAYDRLVAEARRLREEHYRNRVRLQTEQVWPDLFHIFARAGWTITPKLLKENIGSVVMSIALGAAIQYQEAGTTLWASPDLWNWDRYPGHSPRALRSALLTAYWLGAETIYVENLDSHDWSPRHPEADPQGSLIRWSDAENYELTKHGRVVRDFYTDYVPKHPRSIDWRDYDPKVAIIRLPDGGWGQFAPAPGRGEPASRDRLLGNREMPLDGPASEWLAVWPILTHGAARAGSISAGNPFIYPKQIEEYFAPIDSVAVFDHNVEAAALAGVDCLIVCGHALSARTFLAVRDRVAAGATCIIARRLYAHHSQESLPGNWLVVDDFKDSRIARALSPFLGSPDVARFRFKNAIVEFRRAGEPDAIDVRVVDRKRS